MRHHIAHALLSIFVITLVVSNVILATQVSALRERTPALINASSPTPSISAIPTLTPFPLPSFGPISKYVKITSLTPSAGVIGTKVTIKGSGFTRTNNTIYFNYHQISGVRGTSTKLVFTVPAYLIYSCSPNLPCPTNLTTPVVPGTYYVRVSNSKGTSNAAIFSVTPQF